MKTKLFLVTALALANTAFANVCDRNPLIIGKLLQYTGAQHCSQVTNTMLLGVREFYVEGTNTRPVKGIRKIEYKDLKGLKNVTTMVFEFTYVDTIAPGAFADMKSLQTLEVSHSRIAKYAPNAFCGTYTNGQSYGLPSLKSLDLDSNRFQKSWTLPVELFSCLSNLTSVDVDSSGLKFLPVGIFANNKKLVEIDVMNNPLPAAEITKLQRSNPNAFIEHGIDPQDGWEEWQLSEQAY